MENDEPETDKTVQIVKDTEDNSRDTKRCSKMFHFDIQMSPNFITFYSSAHLYQNSINTHHRTYRHRLPHLRALAVAVVVQFISLMTIILVTSPTVITVMIPQIITIEVENPLRVTHNSYRRLERKILPKDVVLLRYNGKGNFDARGEIQLKDFETFSGHTKSTDTNLSQNFSDNQPFVHFVRISYGDSGNKGINVKVREVSIAL